MADNEPDDYFDDDLEPSDDAVKCLPLALLESVVGAKGIQEISTRNGFCLVVQAPSVDWVTPIYKAIKRLGDWDYYVNKSSMKRSRSDDDTSERMVEALAGGGRVFGVSQQPAELLPSAMLTAADKTIVLPPIPPQAISKAIKAVTGNLPVEVPPTLGRGLTFDEIVSCIRRNATAAECVDRLRRAADSKVSAVTSSEDVPPIQSLHGMGPAKTWALELVDDLEAWRRGEISFGEISSASCIIAGPPGVGKTALLRSLSKSTGLPLVATSVGEWFASSPGYLDSIIKKIDETFSAAKAVAPAIVFLDELDAVPSRATISPRGADWWLPVITHLLTTLDGAVSGKTDKLVVVGATNHPERLDRALTRAGRFSRILEVGPPDEEALAGILRQHLGKDLANVDLREAARLAAGSTGAVVVEWVRAARRRARIAKRSMSMADLLEVIAPPDVRTPELVWRIAVHESGHAVAAYASGLGRVNAVSIVQGSTFGGYTMVEHDGKAPTRREMERMVVQLLSGRAAEEVILGEAGTGSGGGPQSDLAVATRSIGLLHLGTGLGSHLVYQANLEEVPMVLATNPDVRMEVEKDLRRLYARAVALVRENRVRVEALATDLVKQRHVGTERFLHIMGESSTALGGKETANG
ncbi:AAA family ATPase [Devosia submarina]|uniref:AAA family ATPase n=1 Tax=Devosia submarina TaxID=1173082 RepID=UPI000D34860D|nr:AAA family ATPase [Devosia submarina]